MYVCNQNQFQQNWAALFERAQAAAWMFDHAAEQPANTASHDYRFCDDEPIMAHCRPDSEEQNYGTADGAWPAQWYYYSLPPPPPPPPGPPPSRVRSSQPQQNWDSWRADFHENAANPHTRTEYPQPGTVEGYSFMEGTDAMNYLVLDDKLAADGAFSSANAGFGLENAARLESQAANGAAEMYGFVNSQGNEQPGYDSWTPPFPRTQEAASWCFPPKGNRSGDFGRQSWERKSSTSAQGRSCDVRNSLHWSHKMFRRPDTGRSLTDARKFVGQSLMFSSTALASTAWNTGHDDSTPSAVKKRRMGFELGVGAPLPPVDCLLPKRVEMRNSAWRSSDYEKWCNNSMESKVHSPIGPLEWTAQDVSVNSMSETIGHWSPESSEASKSQRQAMLGLSGKFNSKGASIGITDVGLQTRCAMATQRHTKNSNRTFESKASPNSSKFSVSKTGNSMLEHSTNMQAGQQAQPAKNPLGAILRAPTKLWKHLRRAQSNRHAG